MSDSGRCRRDFGCSLGADQTADAGFGTSLPQPSPQRHLRLSAVCAPHHITRPLASILSCSAMKFHCLLPLPQVTARPFVPLGLPSSPAAGGAAAPAPLLPARGGLGARRVSAAPGAGPAVGQRRACGTARPGEVVRGGWGSGKVGASGGGGSLPSSLLCREGAAPSPSHQGTLRQRAAGLVTQGIKLTVAIVSLLMLACWHE